jgi:hypothetical protein
MIHGDAIEQGFRRLPSVTTVSVNYVSNTVLVHYDPNLLTHDEISIQLKTLHPNSSTKKLKVN